MSIYFTSGKIRRNLFIISIPPVYRPNCILIFTDPSCRLPAQTDTCAIFDGQPKT